MKDRIAWEQQEFQEAGKAGGITLFTIAWHIVRSRPDWYMQSALPGLNVRGRVWESNDKDELKAKAERLLRAWLEKVGA